MVVYYFISRSSTVHLAGLVAACPVWEQPGGNSLEVHLPGLQGAALRALVVQPPAQLLGLALVLLEVSPRLTHGRQKQFET